MKKYTLAEAKEIFKQAGLKQNDALFVHSALHSLGVADCSFSEIPAQWIKLLNSLCGALLMPSFNYSFPKTKFADLNTLVSEVGILSEAFRQSAPKRSNHPMFSISGSGEDINNFISDKMEQNPFLQDSTYHRLHQNNAMMAFIGIDIRVCTFMVYVEAVFGVKYRYFKPFFGKLITKEGKEFEGEFYHFCLPQSEKCAVNFFRAQDLMLQNGILKCYPLGASKIFIFRTKEFFDFITELLSKEPFILQESPPKHFYCYKLGKEVVESLVK